MKQVLIARHGNTFLPGIPARRVGRLTDLPLVESERASRIGTYLATKFQPDIIYCSPLLRTKQTAEIAIKTAQLSTTPIIFDERFLEIDYGPDENQEESVVIQRIGQEAMDLWNTKAIVPDGWSLDVVAVKQSWLQFFHNIEQDSTISKVLIVTSNGIARFAPSILENAQPTTSALSSLKIKTGNLSLFEKQQHCWHCIFWDQKPLELLKSVDEIT